MSKKVAQPPVVNRETLSNPDGGPKKLPTQPGFKFPAELPFRYGVEISFIPKLKGEEPEHSYDDKSAYQKLSQHRDKVIAKLSRLKGLSKAYDDNGAIEIPIGTFKSIEKGLATFQRAKAVAKKNGYVPHNSWKNKDGETVVDGTGGGHVHLELLPMRCFEDRMHFIANMFKFVMNRPWLGWVFNEFSDDSNACAIIRNSELRDMAESKWEFKRQMSNIHGEHRTMTFEDVMLRQMASTVGKSWGLKLKCHNENQEETKFSYSFEFRFFDAPDTDQCFRDHLDFAIAVYGYVLANSFVRREGHDSQGEPLWVSQPLENSLGTVERDSPAYQVDLRTSYKSWEDALKDLSTEEKVEAAFRQTVEQLGLSWKRYSRYMQKYRDRVTSGELV